MNISITHQLSSDKSEFFYFTKVDGAFSRAFRTFEEAEKHYNELIKFHTEPKPPKVLREVEIDEDFKITHIS